MHDRWIASRLDVTRLQGTRHLLEHHGALGDLQLAMRARIRIESHFWPAFRRGTALGRVVAQLSLRVGGRKVVDREEAGMLVPDWAPTCILLAKVNTRALPVLALCNVLASGQLLHVVRVWTHHFLCAAVHLLDPPAIGGSSGQIVTGRVVEAIVRSLINGLPILVWSYGLSVDATFLSQVIRRTVFDQTRLAAHLLAPLCVLRSLAES